MTRWRVWRQLRPPLGWAFWLLVVAGAAVWDLNLAPRYEVVWLASMSWCS